MIVVNYLYESSPIRQLWNHIKSQQNPNCLIPYSIKRQDRLFSTSRALLMYVKLHSGKFGPVYLRYLRCFSNRRVFQFTLEVASALYQTRPLHTFDWGITL